MADAELDIKIAVAFFGASWHDMRAHPPYTAYGHVAELRDHGLFHYLYRQADGSLSFGSWPFRYSSDISAAWLVVEEIASRGYHWKLQTPFEVGELCHAGFTKQGTTGWNGRPDFNGSSTSMATAICLAALAFTDSTTSTPITQ